MHGFANFFLLTYATLFPLISPVGNAPLFLSLTRSRSVAQRNILARRVAINCFFMLLGSMLVGSYVLEFFGISLPVVRLGGGLVVAALGWQLLNSGSSEGADASSSKPASDELDAFYPYTMPLTVGPGSMSAAIALGSQRPGTFHLSELFVIGPAAVAGIMAVALTIYLCYRYAEGMVRRLGPSGTNVVVRMSAFLLLCIGIQIFWTGWSSLMATL